jgi:circadian clock protein KaiB
MTPSSHPSENRDQNRDLFPPEAQDVADYLEGFEPERYKFRLYVSKRNAKSILTIKRFERLCEEYLPGRYELEIIDIHEHPEMLQQDQIFAVPTLIKQLPPPFHRLIGDLSDTELVVGALGL